MDLDEFKGKFRDSPDIFWEISWDTSVISCGLQMNSAKKIGYSPYMIWEIFWDMSITSKILKSDDQRLPGIECLLGRPSCGLGVSLALEKSVIVAVVVMPPQWLMGKSGSLGGMEGF